MLASVVRSTSGHRRYSERDLTWIEMITRLRSTVRRLPPVRGDAGAGRGVLLHRRPALDHDRLRAGGSAGVHARGRRDALRHGPRPGPLDRLRAEPRHRARRGRLAAERASRASASCGRMTQFKEKSEGQDFVSAGLFTYPVLMAGDILLYQTEIVPIGDDQRQHLELTRDVAERFNQRFGETFTIPHGVYPEEGARIRNLQEPERLMSTTRGAPQGVVRMIDEPDVIRKKFKTAVTDSETRDPPRPERRSRASRTCSRSCPSPPASRSPSSSAATRAPATGEFKEDVGEAVVDAARADPGALPTSCAPTSGSCSACSRSARRRRGGRASRRSRRCTSAWASSRPRPDGCSAQRGPAVCKSPAREGSQLRFDRVTTATPTRRHVAARLVPPTAAQVESANQEGEVDEEVHSSGGRS